MFTIILSCHNDKDTSNDFMITVDSIKVPDTISSATPFDIEFFGTIGFDGCFSFKTFNLINKENDIIIETWGTYNTKNGICPTEMVSLDGQKLRLTIPLPGKYRIVINEPASYSLVKQITVN